MKWFHKLTAAALLAAAVLCLVGCGGKPQTRQSANSTVASLLFGAPEDFTPAEGGALCVIAARRANTRWPAALPDDFEQTVREAFVTRYDEEYQKYRAELTVWVIVSDGRPTAVPLQYKLAGNTAANLQLQMDDAVRQVTEYLYSPACAADDEGADLMAALAEARALQQDSANRTIVIVDSGLTDTGYLDMTKNDLTLGTVEEAVAAIDPAAFCDLAGTGVLFVNLGNCCDGQPDYRTSNTYRARMEQVWTAILAERCGASLLQPIRFEAAGGTDQVCAEDGSGLPWVAPVQFAVSGESAERSFYSIPANSIGFLPDKATFRDPAMAAETVRAAALWLSEYLTAHPDEQVYVVGSIAKTSPTGSQSASRVSAARAEAVAQLLTQYGIPAEKLIPTDIGTGRGSWSAAGEYAADGTPNEAARQANRQVVLIPSGAAEAAELTALRN